MKLYLEKAKEKLQGISFIPGRSKNEAMLLEPLHFKREIWALDVEKELSEIVRNNKKQRLSSECKE